MSCPDLPVHSSPSCSRCSCLVRWPAGICLDAQTQARQPRIRFLRFTGRRPLHAWWDNLSVAAGKLDKLSHPLLGEIFAELLQVNGLP